MRTCKTLLLPCLVAAARSGPACCAISGPGTTVQFAGQTNIVVWDPETRTEHFIRNAQFSSARSKVGFIAPTPSVPEIGEASVEAFDYLKSYEPRGIGCSGSETRGTEGTKSADVAGTVEVLQEVEAAGHRLTTVKATDAPALARWMKVNGFATNPEVEAWTGFYIRKNWYLTLFKVINANLGLTTGTVRLSFQTDVPFNPYLVPKTNYPEQSDSAGLQLFVVSPNQLEPTLNGKVHLQPKWRAEIGTEGMRTLEARLGLHDKSTFEGGHIAFFDDRTFPNAAPDDLVFRERSVPIGEKLSKFFIPETVFWVVIFGIGIAIFKLIAWVRGNSRRVPEPG